MYDNSIGIERIKKEFNHIKYEAVISLIEGDISTINNDYKHLRVSFKGPKGTPYDNGIYYFDISLKNDYPSSKPSVCLKFFHPNIELGSGEVCLYYINNYSKYNTLSELILIIYYLLANPNFEDKLNPLAKKEDYEKTAKEYNNKYANKLENWTTYDFIPIIIKIHSVKPYRETSISVQLNEKVFSAKEKYNKLTGNNELSKWVYNGDILCDSCIFEKYEIENDDIIVSNDHPYVG